ncbi:MAG: hypothetical protein AAGH92_13715, partial [Planctomycetota bacterium]
MSEPKTKPEDGSDSAGPGFTDVSESPILKQLNGVLHSLTPVFDETGELLSWAMQPEIDFLKMAHDAEVPML